MGTTRNRRDNARRKSKTSSRRPLPVFRPIRPSLDNLVHHEETDVRPLSPVPPVPVRVPSPPRPLALAQAQAQATPLPPSPPPPTFTVQLPSISTLIMESRLERDKGPGARAPPRREWHRARIDQPYEPGQGATGYGIVYRPAPDETFDGIVDIVNRVYPHALGRYFAEVKPEGNGTRSVFIWLCFLNVHSVVSVLSKDVWGRKGARGQVVSIEWPRDRENRREFFHNSLRKLDGREIVQQTGSVRELLVGLETALRNANTRMRGMRKARQEFVARTFGRRPGVKTGNGTNKDVSGNAGSERARESEGSTTRAEATSPDEHSQ